MCPNQSLEEELSLFAAKRLEESDTGKTSTPASEELKCVKLTCFVIWSNSVPPFLLIIIIRKRRRGVIRIRNNNKD